MEDTRLLLLAAPNPTVMLDSVLALPNERQTLVCVMLWNWWTTRNKTNAGELERSTAEVCRIIQKHVIEFQQPPSVCPEQAIADQPTHGRDSRRMKPGPSLVKVNVDAAFWEPLRTGSWGFIARDGNGEFVAAAAGKLRHLRSAL
jgi:hypothetical protein